MKASYAWILLGIAIAVILYLVFRPLPVINNKDQIHRIDSLNNDNNILRKSLTAEFFNFSHFKDSSTKVIDSLIERNHVLNIDTRALQQDKQILAEQILNHNPGESIDTPCIELAKKVIADSSVILDYQKNAERLIFTFSDAVNNQL
jgi:hypothetical protein